MADNTRHSMMVKTTLCPHSCILDHAICDVIIDMSRWVDKVLIFVRYDTFSIVGALRGGSDDIVVLQ